MDFECHGLSKSYNGKAVLRDVSLSLPEGEVTTLMGHSGSGKTTLLRCLSLLETPDAGEIRIGSDKYQFGMMDAVRSHPSIYPAVTVVFQQLFLWPHLTCRANLELASPDRSELERWIGYFDMSEFLDRRPGKASVGQQQRVALVRALALQPRVLLLDEVTSALDDYLTMLVQQCLLTVTEKGTAVLLVTHDNRIAKNFGGPAYRLNLGELDDDS